MILETLVAALLVIGGVFTLIGSLGLARLPDFYTRLHGPTKATTLGVGALILGSIVHFALLEPGVNSHEFLIVLFLFAFVLYRAIRIASRVRSRFASHVVMGAAAILLFQMLVNIGMTLGFMPVTGLPLPFLSYGGTSLVLAWALIGLIVAADYRWQEY